MHIPVLRGRAAEHELLGAVLADAEAGRGAALLLAGELGIGKSALLGDAAIRAGGFTVLRAAGVGEEAHLPYAGLAGLLEPLAVHIDQLADAHRQALRRVLRGEGCPDAERLVLRLAVLALLDAAARERPVLCCVDDVDLLDPASCDAVAFTARRLSHRRAAVLLASTADEWITG
ncbi:MAG: ATP-binding protein, partial [Hamadaea sp.]|nr:ATP-binding protein [Hamadaea sp.]